MHDGVYLVGAFHEMVELLEGLNIPILGLIDQEKNLDQCCKRYSIMGDDQWLLGRGPQNKAKQIVISPDSPSVRKALIGKYCQAGFEFPVIVGGDVSKYAQLGEGTVIQRHAFVSAGCVIGTAVKVNVGAKIMHNSIIGCFSTVAPQAVVLGGVTVGKSSYIGANATILPGVVIGDDVTVGAGAVVTKDIRDGETVKGVPAK